ncbi:von Willebrand factor A domain-containing protein 5A [Hypsibius exemplaris]|uniref:von Willebrand factor A domain-containing protein 5A n=1 Tax=Hypsibius exemplaris TaxID=2072580 RepID=A0A1W0XD34_HYPEX|nr:von Willebrand factor A domain-containing protein 5A [Hypsibius exemplaris]
MANHYFCGLFIKDTNKPIPLTAVKYDLKVKSFACRITIEQTFQNEEGSDLECVYGFPINDQAAVVGFTVVIDGRILHSQFKKKEEAFHEYNAAIQRGDGAYLLDQSERSDDTFVLSVGRLPPRKECKVSIVYVCTLESVTETKMRLVIPTSLSPRYSPAGIAQQGGVAPPNVYNHSVTYSATLTGHITAIDTIQSVASPSHPLAVSPIDSKTVAIAFAGAAEPLNRDLIIDVEIKNNPQYHIEVEKVSRNKYAAMYAYVPKLIPTNKIQSELIFLVDCSGSMQGGRIEKAVQAMQIFLRSIPAGCYFNFFRFGSNFEVLFPTSKLYGPDTFANAKRYADQTTANLGGTEILPPLQHIFSTPPVAGFARQLFILTDGDVTNTESVINLVAQNTRSTRVFSFGIGNSPSRSLVNGVAMAGNGKAEFIKDGEQLEDKIGRHLARALQPAVVDAAVVWKGVENVQQVPNVLPPVFCGDRQLVFAFFENLQDDAAVGIAHSAHDIQKGSSKQSRALMQPPPIFSTTVPPIPIEESILRLAVTSSSENGDVIKAAAQALIQQLDASSNFDRSTTSTDGKSNTDSADSNILSKLAARALIKQLEVTASTTLKPEMQQEITHISLEHGVMSKYVSLVAFEERTQTQRDQATEIELREIPVQLALAGSHPSSSVRHYGLQSMMQTSHAPFRPSFGGQLHQQHHFSATSGFGNSAPIPPGAASASVLFGNASKQSMPASHGSAFVFGNMAPRNSYCIPQSIGFAPPAAASIAYAPPAAASIGYAPSAAASIGFAPPAAASIGFAPPAAASICFASPAAASIGFAPPAAASIGFAPSAAASTFSGFGGFGATSEQTMKPKTLPASFGLSSGGASDEYERDGPTAVTPLNSLLNLQQWDGTWMRSVELESITGVTVTVVKDWLLQIGLHVDDVVAATLLAVVYVTKKFANDSNVWQALVNKAAAHLDAQLPGTDKSQAMTEIAAKMGAAWNSFV